MGLNFNRINPLTPKPYVLNGDDYSCHISAIMDALGNTAGILLTREDLTEDYLEALKELIADAEENDVTYNYVGNPYPLINELHGSLRKTTLNILR